MAKGRMYTATSLGRSIGQGPHEVNILLEEMGFQEKTQVVLDTGRKMYRWEATEKGKPYAEIMRGNRNGQAYEMLVWNQEVADMLGVKRPPSRDEFDALFNKVRADKIELSKALLDITDLKAKIEVISARLGM